MISNSIQFGVFFSVCVCCLQLRWDGNQASLIFMLVVVVIVLGGGENKQGLLPSIICIIFPPSDISFSLSLSRCKDMNLLKGKCIIICIYMESSSAFS